MIVEFDGSAVDSMEDLPRVVAATPVGSEVEVVVLRNGRKKRFDVTIGVLEDKELAEASPEGGAPEVSGLTRYGLRVQELTPEIAEQLGLEEETGVVITAVERGSPAADANLRRGDVILEVEREPVDSASDLSEKLAGGDSALLLIRRGESTIFVAMKRASE